MQPAVQGAMQGAPIIGDVIFEGFNSFFSPWFARGGDAARFAIEIIAISGVSLSWEVETKNSEDADSSAVQIGTTTTTTTTGISRTGKFTGCKELVRYKYKTGATDSIDWVHLRALNPAWLYN